VKVSFVRHRERRDRVHVTRQDGSSTAWDFPSYGNRLPHDLCHLAVEEALGIANGFWGLVDQGVEVRLVDDQATLVRDGRPLVEEAGIDFSDLTEAERLVALFGPTGIRTEKVGAITVAHLDPSVSAAAGEDAHRSALGVELPPGISEEAIASLRRRLVDLGEQWRGLGDGAAITLTYTGGPR
jgi:hypothetical protein